MARTATAPVLALPEDITLPGPFGTLGDIRRRHRGHWFDKDTLRFFSSRFPDGEYGTYAGRFFISTERDTFGHEPRRATIRYATDDGDIRTLGEFQAYATPEHARKALRATLRAAGIAGY